ncbi:MAG: hypothetical protein BWY57_02146 [Betaproteobacteria bacterium ADurb.Bin341]|nr:MAG: hypothetical protein BWY57_02146 [Betaproteobacteria bacterium ADurb.Bin341]
MDAEKRKPGQRGPGKKRAKVRVTIRLDAEIVEYLKEKALKKKERLKKERLCLQGLPKGGWQTKANAILLQWVQKMKRGEEEAKKLPYVW